MQISRWWMVVIVIIVGVGLYVNALQMHLERYSQLQLTLHDVRVSLEDRGMKDIAYSRCVVDYAFWEMWFPWTFGAINNETEDTIKHCTSIMKKVDAGN